MGQKLYSSVACRFLLLALWLCLSAAFSYSSALASVYEDVLYAAELGDDDGLLSVASRLCREHPGLTPDIAALSVSLSPWLAEPLLGVMLPCVSSAQYQNLSLAVFTAVAVSARGLDIDRLVRVAKRIALRIDLSSLQSVADALSMMEEGAWSYQYVLSLLSPHDVEEYRAILNGGSAFQRASLVLRDSLLSDLSVPNSYVPDPGAIVIAQNSRGFSPSEPKSYELSVQYPSVAQPRPYVPLFLLPSPS